MNHGGSQRDLQGNREHVLGVSLMLHPDAIPPKTRRHLSFDPLIRQIRLRAKQLPDTRNASDCSYSMADAVMSAFALFALKDPSLLFFQERRNDENMKSLPAHLEYSERHADASDSRSARTGFAPAPV